MAKRRSRAAVRVRPYTRKGKPVKGYIRGGPVRSRSGVKIRLPEEDISPAFRKFTAPVSPSKKRDVYVFLEVDEASTETDFDFLREYESAPIPIKIGPYTRSQLARLSRAEILEQVSLFKPGISPGRILGFGHALTRLERKGKRFTRAQARGRKSRKTGTTRRNLSTKKGRKKS